MAEHRDNSRSAWQRDRKRPGWDALLADIESGEVDAVVVWHGDRLLRQPWDLERLINLVEQRGLLIASMSGQRDLANPDDRSIIRIETTMACRESDSTARRVRRVAKERAEQGQRHGAVPYGWRDANEGVVVREIVTRLLAGTSLRTLHTDLNARQIPAPRGGDWTSTQVRQIAKRAANAGLSTYKGAVVADAQWPALVSTDDHERVVRLLSDPKRKTSPQVSQKHLLSGIARCGKCDGVMRRVKVDARRKAAYRCENLDVSIQAAPLEELILALLKGRLNGPEADALTQPHTDAHEALESRLMLLRSRLDGLAADYADDVLDRQQMRVASDRLRENITSVEAELRDLEKRDAALQHRGVDVFRLSAEAQRSLIIALIELRIMPASRFGTQSHALDTERVQVTWR